MDRGWPRREQRRAFDDRGRKRTRPPLVEHVGLALAVIAQLALLAARWTRRRALPVVAAWSRDLDAAVQPLREEAVAGWAQLVGHDLPALRRWLEGRLALVAAGLATAAARAGRGARPGLVVIARSAARLLPRVIVVVVAMGLVGWFTPGPVLGVAARFTDVGDPAFGPLSQRSVVTAADGAALGVVHAGENRRVVPLDEVPPLVRRLVVVAEDRRFFEHRGFDQAGIVRAAIANVRSRGVSQGASTITQQLVKQNLVGDDRSPLRKLRELVLAVAVERRTTKHQLLARYLNEVYFGAGAYGIAAASETYFGTDPERLRPEQGALLAALIRAPSSLDPWRDPPEARARRDELLRAAADEGALEPARAAELTRADLGLLARPRTPGIADRDLVGAVEREIAARPELGGSPAERVRRFRSGGWSVETTIDPAIQEAARQAVAQRSARAGAPGAAVAVVEPGTGRVRALYSRRPAELAQVDLASAGRRQPGSAFKPLAAIAALEAGLDPAQRLEGRSGVAFDLGREVWEVQNFADRDHPRPDLEDALRDSVNSAFAQIGVAVGPDRMADVAARLGIVPSAALGRPAERGPAMALGGVRHGVTPLELAGAYAAIANDGSFVRPTLIERIVDADGREVLRRASRPRPGVAPAVNASVRSMLQAVVSEGTGTGAVLDGWQAFGKTGTSQDRADAWFVGAVPSLAAAVWVGDPRARTPMPTATGGSVAAPAWREVMAAALRGRPTTAFAAGSPLPPTAPLRLPEARPPSHS